MREQLYGIYLPELKKNNKREFEKYGILYEAKQYGACPCGSGNTFHFCHFKEFEKEKINRKRLQKNVVEYKKYISKTLSEIISQSSGEFGSEFKTLVEKPTSSESLWNCLAVLDDNDLNSKCGSKMGSHTIYKSKGLSVLGELLEIDKFQLRIAPVETNTPKDTPQGYEDLKKLGFDSISNKSASKVNVLCRNHDEELFRSIEQCTKSTNQDNYVFTGCINQLNAYSLRALILQYYTIILHVKRQQTLVKRNINFLFDITYQKEYEMHIYYIDFFLKKLNRHISNQVALDSKRISNFTIFSFSRLLNNKPTFSGCFSFYLPGFPLDDPLFINILPQNNKTLILITTDHVFYAEFLHLLKECEDQEIISIVSGIIASFGSNLYFSKNNMVSYTNEELANFMNEWRKDKKLSFYWRYPDHSIDGTFKKINIVDPCESISKILF